ncbi:MAG TPA: zf-HC2 domain-containing protein [Acidimicrobiales bacterium]|nr:zf-HC2 domain-containing protein [Acidimicrobiales bacterium]
MTCSESRLLAFLAGDLSEDENRSFDEHLLFCESCWQPVQEDRIGRLAGERLRVQAPQGLTNRVVLAVEIAARERAGTAETGARGNATAFRHREPLGEAFRRASRRVRRRLVIATVVVAAGLAGGLSWSFVGGPAEVEPAQVAAVIALAPSSTHAAKVGGPARHLVAGGQQLLVRSYRVDGVVAVVATSKSAFPMPAVAHVLAGSSPTAWLATHGRLALYCVNRPAGRESMLLVAPMPAVELPQVAAKLHLL